MCIRWTAAGMLETERQFGRIIGHTDLAKLALAVEHDVAAKAAIDRPHTSITTPGTGGRRYTGLGEFLKGSPSAKFHGDRDILGANRTGRS